jgi:phosphoribosyl 1,2-cyclic phosphodiesterase
MKSWKMDDVAELFGRGRWCRDGKGVEMDGKNWRVEIWGSRGSYPRPEKDFLKYGGNTSCVSLTYDGGIVILDAGSGLAGLGRRLAVGGRESLDAPIRRVDILLSHLHLDHVQGLPSFQPFYNSEMEVRLYGLAGFERHLKMLAGPPYWPVGVSGFAAKVSFHELRPGERFFLNGLTVTTMAGNHPGGSILYRIDDANADGGKKSLVYALDCETDEGMFRQLAEFAKDTDFLLWDAGFTDKDLKAGWGHSTWEQGVAVRRAARAKKAVMMHYNAEYDDVFLQRLEEAAGNEDGAVLFAREGMELC